MCRLILDEIFKYFWSFSAVVANNIVPNVFSPVGVTDLIITATKDCSIAEKIKALSWKIQSKGVRI